MNNIVFNMFVNANSVVMGTTLQYVMITNNGYTKLLIYHSIYFRIYLPITFHVSQ